MYLRFGTDVFLLCDKSWGQIPIGITVENYPELISKLRPKQGMLLPLRDGQLIFSGGNLCLQRQKTALEEKAELRPLHSNILQAAQALAQKNRPTGISMLVHPLVLRREEELPQKQNLYFVQAQRYFEKLVEAFLLERPDEVTGYTEKLLGLGAGLTPSADDAFLGMLYIFRRLARPATPAIVAFRNTIAGLAETHTNQISAAYLSATINGAPFERMEWVYRGMCGAEWLNIENLVEIGSNSGSEMLLGMLIALRICGYDVSEKEK
jgi:hypothetical protein